MRIAAEEFASHMAAAYDTTDPRAALVAGVRRFVDFCTADLARYQLLFQRTLPGFERSPESYAAAVRALDGAREHHLEGKAVERRAEADVPCTQSPIADEPYASVLVFPDPDNIQLELSCPPGT